MKLNKLILPLALVIAASLATTGCKKGYSGYTPLPRGGAMVGPSTGDTSTLPSGGQMGGDQGNQLIAGQPIPSTSSWDPATMTQDRTALAAYTVHFPFDSATITDAEQAKITSVAQYLTGNPNAKLLIEGNCDERGTEEYNRTLGDHRALALREALAKDSIDPDRIRTISYGKDKPVDPGHNETAWAKNRRGDFVVCTPKN